MIRSHRITLTTNAEGVATGVTRDFVGLLHALIYVPGTIATGADLTVTDEVTGTALLAITNAGTSALHKLPRCPTVDAANAASLYAATGEPVEDRYAIVGRVKCAVAEGGDSKAGALIVVWEE